MYFQVARKNFQFGMQYAFVIVIFAIAVTFSVTSPIIAPFGMYKYTMLFIMYISEACIILVVHVTPYLHIQPGSYISLGSVTHASINLTINQTCRVYKA